MRAQAFAAGVLLKAKSTRRVLLLRRAAGTHDGGTWNTPGGKREDGETSREAAIRETHEETGDVLGLCVDKIPRHIEHIGECRGYRIFCGTVPREFVPVLDHESDAYVWISPVKLLREGNVEGEPVYGSILSALRK